MGNALCREFDSHRLHICFFLSVRAEDVENDYYHSSLLSSTSVVSGEGRAPEIPVANSVIIRVYEPNDNNIHLVRHRLYHYLPTKLLLSQVIKY